MQRPITLHSIKPLRTVRVCFPFYRALREPAILLSEQIAAGFVPSHLRMYTIKESVTLLYYARNDFVSKYDTLPWDFIVFIDDDMGFPPAQMHQVDSEGITFMVRLIEKLVDHDLDIVGATFTHRTAPFYPAAFQFDEKKQNLQYIINLPDEDKVIEVDSLGLGLVCVKRRVFDAMKADRDTKAEMFRRYQVWRQNNQKAFDELPEEVRFRLTHSGSGIRPPFFVEYRNDLNGDHNWQNVTEDVSFSLYAKALGFKIHLDLGAPVGHQSDFFATPQLYRSQYMNELIARYYPEKKQEEHGNAEPNMAPVTGDADDTHSDAVSDDGHRLSTDHPADTTDGLGDSQQTSSLVQSARS